VPQILPRPELSDLLGIAYRRIPILAIGNDVYCDSSLIASALERKFSKSDGCLSLFPARKGGVSADTGMIKAFSMYYADRTLFSLASACLPLREFGESFRKDRSDVRPMKSEFHLSDSYFVVLGNTYCS
jgi:glutathione S-transferase